MAQRRTKQQPRARRGARWPRLAKPTVNYSPGYDYLSGYDNVHVIWSPRTSSDA